AACLLAGAFGELRTADAFREPQVILDVWAAAGLAADGVALDQYGAEPLRGTIDGGTEPGRPGAVDRQIVFRSSGIAEPAELFGNLADRRVLQASAVRKEADRQPRIIQVSDARLGARLLVADQLDPLERHVAAMEEVAD